MPRERTYWSPDPTASASPSSSFYSKAEFDEAKQNKYKVAVAEAADTTAANIDILSITEGRRRAGSVKVETKVSRLRAHLGKAVPALSRVQSCCPCAEARAHCGRRSEPSTQRGLTSSSRRLGPAMLSRQRSTLSSRSRASRRRLASLLRPKVLSAMARRWPRRRRGHICS